MCDEVATGTAKTGKTFKAGDRVRLLAEPRSGGQRATWPEKFTGREGVVQHVGDTLYPVNGNVFVNVEGVSDTHRGKWMHAEDLEPVAVARAAKFKTGDRVRFLAEPTSDNGKVQKWDHKFKGTLATVVFDNPDDDDVDGNVQLRADVDGELWWMLEAKLELASAINVGDRVRFLAEPTAGGKSHKWAVTFTGTEGTVRRTDGSSDNRDGTVRVEADVDDGTHWWMPEHKIVKIESARAGAVSDDDEALAGGRASHDPDEPVGSVFDTVEPARYDARGDTHLWGIPADKNGRAQTFNDLRGDLLDHPEPPDPPAGRVCPRCGLTSCMHPRVPTAAPPEDPADL